MFDTIAIVGLGLIGGSLAKTIRARTRCRVLGTDSDPRVIEKALLNRAIDAEATDQALAEADLVFLCLYPAAAVEFAAAHGALLKGSVVCDVSGIKRWICARMPEIAAKNGFTFIGVHPMAGKERSGFDASDSALFQGASFITVPCGAPEKLLNELESFAVQLGFGRCVRTTPEEHDRMIAFTSQLPHVLACAYVQSPCCPKHNGFSAGSYRDVSRVARINETLWTELFLENREPLCDELDLLIRNICAIRDAAKDGDAETLRSLLQKSREIKERLGE